MSNRIAEMRRAAGLSQQDLADAAGTGRSQIVKLERGERRLTVDWMVRLAGPLRCAPRDLLPDAGGGRMADVPAGPAIAAAPLPLSDALRDLPVCGAARGGSDALFVDQGRPLEWTWRPPPLGGVGNAFAVYAVGDSMEPKFRAGDLLFLNPNLPPVRDAYVVVECTDTEAYVKQFVRHAGDGITLREFRPEEREFTLPLARVKAVYRVVGAWEGR
ncbi:XRE family transcriptional regulator [Zavarzinia sp. CC-PAN008]|uniref:XRE family transcriptional regulator n=1 Tax=Zavarzinia sp. CC-PAN008 TaxID=3243332 RepID=UPI003F743ED4